MMCMWYARYNTVCDKNGTLREKSSELETFNIYYNHQQAEQTKQFISCERPPRKGLCSLFIQRDFSSSFYNNV